MKTLSRCAKDIVSRLFMFYHIVLLLLLFLFTNLHVCNKLKPRPSNWYDHSTFFYLVIVYLILCVSSVFSVLFIHDIYHSSEHCIHFLILFICAYHSSASCSFNRHQFFIKLLSSALKFFCSFYYYVLKFYHELKLLFKIL